ncbi:hypothetical protein BUALT_Bualt12G0065300 [Buddleja alternifolia]|uniref:Uncharacterized protein n=1 Tax=Buddleja alternifolia TaxID=168488 RepID=A0AAV6WZK7_9LAMI|nr:hypothetical protein BUALT_Bualt12G0065300 [Buddleja alternifolia]
MAISDFYSAHPNYTTRLQLHPKNVKSVLHANLSVVELSKVHVPIISFTAGTSALPYKQKSYFVRTTPDDAIHTNN